MTTINATIPGISRKPSSTARNKILPLGAAVVCLTLQAPSAASVNTQEWANTSAAIVAYVDKDGNSTFVNGNYGGTLGVTGNFAVNTNKFTVTASSGNTLVAGTLSVTSDLAVNTNKFTVAASTGNTLVAGTLQVTGVATLTAQPILSSLTASLPVFTDLSKGLVSNTMTGTGSVMMSASPTTTGTLTGAAANFSGTVTFGTYTGQTSIVTLGTVTTGTWTATSISTTYTDAKIKTVTGTTNRLSIGGTATDPTFDISTAYVGQATITTLGTIATGVWNGTVVTVTYGGTGAATLASNAVLYGNGTGAIQALAVNANATNYFLSQVSSGSPVWTASTGTGSVMLATSPTTTGTLTAAAVNMSGILAVSISSDSAQTMANYFNASTGTSAIAIMRFGQSSSLYMAFQYQGSGFTPGGGLSPNQGVIYMPSGVTNGLIVRLDADAPIIFKPLNTETLRIANGVVTVTGTLAVTSTTAFSATATATITQNGNSVGYKSINASNGTGATVSMQVQNDVSSLGIFQMYGSGYTTSTYNVADSLVVFSNGAGGTQYQAALHKFWNPTTFASTVTTTGVHTFTAQPIFSSATASTAAAFDSSKGLISVTNTGTGNNVMSASPTFTGTAVFATSSHSGACTSTYANNYVTAFSATSSDATGTGNVTMGLTNNAGNIGIMRMYGGGFSTGSFEVADGMLIYTNGVGGLSLSAASYKFWTGNVEFVGTVRVNGNLTLFGAGSYGGGSQVVSIANATTDPTTNPTGGGILFCSGGALKYRGSSGTVTTIAIA